jgi:hypothetical protein
MAVTALKTNRSFRRRGSVPRDTLYDRLRFPLYAFLVLGHVVQDKLRSTLEDLLSGVQGQAILGREAEKRVLLRLLRLHPVEDEVPRSNVVVHEVEDGLTFLRRLEEEPSGLASGPDGEPIVVLAKGIAANGADLELYRAAANRGCEGLL